MKDKSITNRRDFLKTTVVATTGLIISGISNKAKAEESNWYEGKQTNTAIDNCRVVCCYDTKMVKAGATFGSTFSAQNNAIDTARVQSNLDEIAKKLAQVENASDAWKMIFQKPATKSWDQVKVAFKINGVYTAILHHIAIIDKICKVLNTIDSPGVPFSNMIIYDGDGNADGSTKYTPYVTNGGLPSGVIVSKNDQSLGGTVNIAVGTSTYSCVKDIAEGKIDILVNCAVNKGHSVQSQCTLTLKNHIGTVKYSCPSSVTDLTNIFKTNAISGGTPPRQQLCIMDSICGAVNGPSSPISHYPYRIVMGTFGPAVDYFTVKKIREPIMKATHTASQIKQFLSNFSYTDDEINNLLTLTPEQNGGKGWLEFTPGTTEILQNNSAATQGNIINFNVTGSPFKNITKKISMGKIKNIRSIVITDIRGRVIQNLTFDEKNKNTLTWNGLNRQGRPVVTGVYFLKISGSNAEKAIRFNIQK